MTPRQQAEYRDEIARMRLADQAAVRGQARAAEIARPKRAYKRRKPAAERVAAIQALPPPPTPAEAALAAKLRPHLCEQSPVDLDAHALNVARTILAHRQVGATA